MLALIWGQHGAQTAAARHFGVAPRSVRRWLAGDRQIPDEVSKALQHLLTRTPIPPIAPPPPGSTPNDDRDDACAEVHEAAHTALALAAERSGWTETEVLAAMLSWTITDMRQRAGDDAARQTLSSAVMMLD